MPPPSPAPPPSPSPPPSFLAVVVAGKEGLRLDALARALAGFLGVPVQDATMAARRARGILAEDLDGPRAADLVRRLAAEGVAARALPAGLLAPPPLPLHLSRAQPGPDGLRTGLPERTLLVPWSRIRLIALAPFRETVFKKVKEPAPPTVGDHALNLGVQVLGHVATAAVLGIPVGIHLSVGEGRTVERNVPKSEFRLLLDLLLEGPSERLRIDPEDFDFSGLGEGMACTSHANLRLLLERIVASTPSAATSLGADLMLTGGRLSSLGYESVEDFERELRWLAAVAA